MRDPFERAARPRRLGHGLVTMRGLSHPGNRLAVSQRDGRWSGRGSRNEANARQLTLAALLGMTLHLAIASEAVAQTLHSPSMQTARWAHAATVLPNGQVLVAGGDDGQALGLSSTEIYDPVGNTWRHAAPMAIARDGHTATLLHTGKVLVMGGVSGGNVVIANAETYDPAIDRWGTAPPLPAPRTFHTATLLGNGKVVVMGGEDAGRVLMKTVLTYDPATHTWTPTADLPTARSRHSATLLVSGRILVTGGADAAGLSLDTLLFDPSTSTWTSAAPLRTPRHRHAAARLPNGDVLIIGGGDRVSPQGGRTLDGAELYEPASDKWTAVPGLVTPRQRPTATALLDGRVLVAAGRDGSGGVLAGTEILTGPAATAAHADVVEYFNAALDHYFITWAADEIAVLDAGIAIKGWQRTGHAFKGYTVAQSITTPICRFYLPPAFGDSHFFGRGTAECQATRENNPGFMLEDPAFMQMFLPIAGNCPALTTPIYRVFSNRADANHRYMTNGALRDQMVARGWLAEGDGADRVVMCALQ